MSVVHLIFWFGSKFDHGLWKLFINYTKTNISSQLPTNPNQYLALNPLYLIEISLFSSAAGNE